jgi:hypothetical protein
MAESCNRTVLLKQTDETRTGEAKLMLLDWLRRIQLLTILSLFGPHKLEQLRRRLHLVRGM